MNDKQQEAVGVFDLTPSSSLDMIARDATDGAMEIMESEGAVSVIGALERAEIDMQIATAKRYPRSIAAFVKSARTLACASPQIAAQCSYAVPRQGKTIIGPSIRLAEIVAPSWKNCRYGGRVVEIGDRFVSVQGFFYDLENNVAVTVDVRRRITDRNGIRYNDDMIQQTCQAAVSIAVRNAIFRGIPGGYVEAIRVEAQDVALGKKEGLEVQRAKALKFFTETYSIKKAVILKTLGVEDEKDITWGHMSRLMGFRTAIDTGESTAEQIFSESPETEGSGPPAAGRKTRGPYAAKAPAKATKVEGAEKAVEGEEGGAVGLGIDPQYAGKEDDPLGI
jgi:hypothetical protein